MRFITAICLSIATLTVGAQPVLTNVAQQSGVVHRAEMANFDMPGQGGAAWFDYNNDGWYDLYLTGGGVPDALYKNSANGTFTNVTAQAGFSSLANVITDGVTTGDINNDGYPEVFVTTFRTDVNHLFLNNTDGTFTEMTDWAGQNDTANSFSAAFGDLNLDGWLDLYVCNWSRYMEVFIVDGSPQVDSEANYYYESIQGSAFVEKADQLGIADSMGCALGVLITDFDNDHDPDLFVANDFGYFPSNSKNLLFRNDGPGLPLTDVSSELGMDVAMNGMGVAKSDIEMDGDLDYYITNIKNDKMMMNGLSGFEDELIDRGLKNDSVWLQDFSFKRKKTGWGAAFFDVDNDLDEDLMVANGDLYYDFPNPCLDSNKLFLNDGDGMFTNVSLQTGVADTYVSRALAYCDFDRDGDLDVFVGITDSIGGSNYSFLYRNDSPPKRWLQVKARGVVNNRDGVGAKVYAHVAGITMMREIGGESSFSSQHWNVAHFGLAEYSVVDSLEVYWPGGAWDRYYNVPSDQFLELIEGQGMITGVVRNKERLDVFPNPFSSSLRVELNEIPLRLELFALDGRRMLIKEQFVSKSVEIDAVGLTSGQYLLRVTTGSGAIVRKLCKY